MVDTSTNQNVNNNEKDCDKIEGLGYSSIVFALAKSLFLGMGTYMMFNVAKIDTYIAVIIGTIIGFISVGIFLYIDNSKKNDDIISLNILLFGKPIGFMINLLLNLLILFMASVVLYNISSFFVLQYIPDTSIIYVQVLILVPIIYAASKNIAVISRISQIIMYITLIFVIISFLGVIQFSDMENILPIMKDGIFPPILGGLLFALFSTTPLFLLTIITKSQIKKEGYSKKKVIIMYIVAGIFLLSVIFGTTVVISYDVISLYKYPEYIALKDFSLFNIIERVENTLALQFIFDMFLFIVIAFYFVITSIKKIVKKNNIQKFLPYLLALIILIIPNMFFKNQIQIIDVYNNFIVYVLIAILALMTITAITLFIKNLINKKKNNNSNNTMQETN